MHAIECNTAENAARQPFVEGLHRIPDPRQRRGRRYAWETLLLLICAALVSGRRQERQLPSGSPTTRRRGKPGRRPRRGACPARRRRAGGCGS